MTNSYSSYTNELDSLIFDNMIDPKHSAMDIESNLALWANAQFKYDIAPGSGLQDEKSSPSTTTTTASSSPETVTYENLADYLDFELPQRQDQPQQQEPNIFPAIPTRTQQLILPKISPEMTIADLTKALFSKPYPITNTIQNKSVISKPKPPTERNSSEDDKRKRNTAASARFRVKKKMREQAMEKSLNAMTEKAKGLENKVDELQLEIKYLRGLLLEKESKKNDEPSS
ncbi:hypothetical protein K501DRAFT_211337 [Backusella circina FSU 941]|nr:hypothetical protein K501DRAFT_211337 [Backusella circina FSU 941]